MVGRMGFAKALLNADQRNNKKGTRQARRAMLFLVVLGLNPWLSAMAAESSSTQARPDFMTLPDFGDPSGALISPLEEQRLGEEFMRSLRRSVNIIDDPEVEEYIQNLGYRLVAGRQIPPVIWSAN